MASAGLYQGLNEAYGAYRGRQREIEDKKRREFRDEEAKKSSARQQEQYEYGITRRGAKEEAEQLALDTGKTQLDQTKGTYKEWVANTANRATKNKLDLDTAKQNFKTSGLVFDDAKISLTAKKGAEKYNKWTRDWLLGGSMEELVEKFNTDEDDTNNIKTVTGDAEKGWDVEFENGRKMPFADRDQVAIHIQSMADPNFHQTYLLQMEAQKASIAAAVAKLSKKDVDTLSKEKTTWENMTRNQVKDYFTESIKESIVSFGSEGSRDIAGDVRAVVDSVGSAGQYGLINSDVTRVANQLAKTMLVKEPADRKQKAEEYLEAQRETGAAIPEEGDDGYEVIIQRQMAEDYDRAYDQYKRVVYTKFFQMDQEGNVGMKDYSVIADAARQDGKGETGDTIPATGLERPGEDPTYSDEGEIAPIPEDTITKSDGAASISASEGAIGLPPRSDPKIMAGPDAAALESSMKPALEQGLKATERNKAERIRKAEQKKWGSDRAKSIGVKLMGNWKREDKAKIKKDFTNNFASLTLAEQEKWMAAFTRGLDKTTRKTALALMDTTGKLAKK